MTEYLAVFRSRAQAADCVTRLQRFGLRATLVNTPQETGVGCGLSVKFPEGEFFKAKQLIAHGGYQAFWGYVKMSRGYGSTRYDKFYG